jgi:hypothetical protein
MQQIRIQIVLSRQARQQSVAIYCRPTTFEQLLRQKATTDGVSARRSTSHTEGRLHVLVRPKGQVLRAMYRARAARLPNIKRARPTIPANWPTDGVVAQPLPLLRVYGHIRTTPPTIRPRWVYDTQGEAYEARRRKTEQALHTTHEVARSESLTLLRRLPPLRCHPGSRASASTARRPPPH